MTTYTGTNGDDTINGGNGDDTISGLGGNDDLSGGNGNDTISGGGGDDEIDGGNGNDNLSGDGGNDEIDGGNGNDTIDGGNDNDTLSGGNGNDTILGGAGNDTLLGENGNDSLTGGGGDDVIDGSNGFDTAYYSGPIGEYSFFSSGGYLHVVHLGGAGADGHDQLKRVERLVFADRVIDIGGGDNAPVAVDDHVFINEDTGTYSSGAASVKDNDFDFDGDALTVTPGVFAGTYGTLTLNANGTYSYTLFASAQALAQGQNVQDSFNYSVSDNDGSDTGTLVFHIAGVNDAPNADPDSAAAGENQTILIDVLANDDDIDNGAVLTVTTASAPFGQGTASVVGNQVQFNPGSDFDDLAVGQTEIVVISYSIADEHGATDSSTITVTVTGTNDAPVAVADTNSGDPVVESGVNPGNTPFPGDASAAGNVLANDTDVDTGDTKTVSAVNGSALNVGTAVTGTYGSVTIAANGSYTYTLNNADPDTNALAQGASVNDVFSYTVQDSNGATSTTSLTITITGTNDAPVAVADTNSGDPVVESGVNPGNTPFPGDASAAGNVLANDTDVDTGDTQTVSAVNGSALNVGTAVTGTYGSVTIAANGSYTYTLNNADPDTNALAQGASVNDVFSYTVQDSNGATSTTSLTITITGTNDAPVAVADTNSGDPVVESGVNPGNTPFPGDASAAGNVLANDTDVDTGDTQTVSAVNGSALNVGTAVTGTYGSVTIASNGSYTYTLNNADPDTNALAQGASVNEVFSYTVQDSSGATSTTSLTITITGTNDAPVAVADTNSGDPVVESGVNPGNTPFPGDASAAGNVLANDTDVDTGDTKTVSAVNGSALNVGTAVAGTYGSVTIASNGSYTYTLNNADPDTNALAQGASVNDVFSYTMQDSNGATSTTSLTITVTGTNDAPTIDAGGTVDSGSVTELPNNDPNENAFTHQDSGTVAFDDADVPDTHSASVTPQGVGYLGSFTLDPVDQMGDSVGWDFSVEDSALDFLDEGETLTQTYTIEIEDANGATVTQDVTITLTGTGDGPQTEWYIDNSAIGSANTGTQADPYTSIAAFNAAQGMVGGPQVGHTVHLLAGTGTGIYAEADGINLLDDQILTGEATGAVRPTIVVTGGANHGIELAQNNIVSGLDIGDTMGADISDSNGAVGNLTIFDVGTSGTGQIIDIDQGGTLNVTLNSASSLGSTGGAVDLANVGGSFTVTGATTITGVHSGGGIDITGASATAIFAGGGTVATLTTTAVNYVGNSGSLAISGGFDILTTSGAGLNATGGGTVTVTGAGNSIASTTGTALNVVSTDIGLAGLTFESISSNGAVNGIVLDSTGMNAGVHGGLTVTGDGGSAVNGSGGTISNSTGVGISLTDTRDINLDQMIVQNGGNDGINGNGVVNFALTNSTILDNGNADEEHGIDLTELTGTAAIDNSTVRGSYEHNFRLLNTTGTLTSLTVTDSIFDHLAVQSGPDGGNGILITLQGTAILTDLAIAGSTFRNNFSNGILVNTENSSRIGADNATSGSTDGAVVANNTFDDNNNAIQFGVFGSSDVTVDIQGNTIVNDNRVDTGGTGGTSTAIVLGTSLSSAAGATLNARIESNIIGDEDIDGSGSSFGSGISLTIQGLADVTALINNNTIREAPIGFGIDVQTRGSTSGTPPTSDVTITNNNVDHTNAAFFPGVSDFPLPAIFVYGDNVGTAGPLNLDVRGNTVPNDFSYNFLGTMIEIFEDTGELHLVDNPVGPGGQTATEQLETSNTGTAGASSGVDFDLIGALPLPPDLFWP